MASVTELAGRLRAPLTYKLVEVTLVVLILLGLKLVAAKRPLTYKLVEVALPATKLAKVPTAVKLGKEVVAARAK